MDNENQIMQEQMNGVAESEEKELLTELVKNSQKQLFHQRVRTMIAVVLAGVIVICMIAVVPVVLRTVTQANEIMTQASETITLANTAIESITEMSESITEMGDNMDTFITENAESVATVMEKIEAVDFEGLNSAIEDLGAVIEPLANFFKKF